MNILEIYITEIHSIKEEHPEWLDKDKELIVVDMTVNCHGHQYRTQHSFFSWEEWKEVKNQGYYIG